MAELVSANPKASEIHAIVFAVNCPPHEPADGQATCSIAFNSLSSIVPRACFPTASKTSTIVKSFPLYFPGSIEPP